MGKEMAGKEPKMGFKISNGTPLADARSVRNRSERGTQDMNTT